MLSLLGALFLLLLGWQGYRQARRRGTWSTKLLLVCIAAAAVTTSGIVLPLVLIPKTAIERHPVPFITMLVLVFLGGMAFLIVYARRVNRELLAKRS